MGLKQFAEAVGYLILSVGERSSLRWSINKNEYGWSGSENAGLSSEYIS